MEEVYVSGVVVGLLHRGPLAHDGQNVERGRRGPLVRTARHARQVEALPDSPSQSLTCCILVELSVLHTFVS